LLIERILCNTKIANIANSIVDCANGAPSKVPDIFHCHIFEHSTSLRSGFSDPQRDEGALSTCRVQCRSLFVWFTGSHDRFQREVDFQFIMQSAVSQKPGGRRSFVIHFNLPIQNVITPELACSDQLLVQCQVASQIPVFGGKWGQIRLNGISTSDTRGTI